MCGTFYYKRFGPSSPISRRSTTVVAMPNDAFGISRKASDSAASCAAGPRCALVFVEYEVTYRIHYRTGVRSMHAKAEKQAQLEPATLGERAEGRGRTDGWTDGRTGG